MSWLHIWDSSLQLGRDAQYHRIGVDLYQIPVNCPFMAKSYASLNFDGPMRSDANHAGNKQYAPNSFKNKFRPDTTEAPYAVSDNIMSRKSHFWHEGKKNDYAQATQLWAKVMTPEQRQNTCKNTAKYLSLVAYPEIQVYNISPDYASGIFELLSKKDFDFSEVKMIAKNAHLMSKERKFLPSDGGKLMGAPPPMPVYSF